MAIREIEGYSEFIRDTSDIRDRFPKVMHEVDLNIANEWLNLAQGRANTPQAQSAAQTLQVNDEGDHVTMTSDSPIFFGAEFGGQARPSTMHFPPWLGREGYWFYPARRDNDDRFADMWDKGIEEAMKPWDHKEL